ncbi:hypothetical protein IWW48_003102 [Coemansia sp. RSA 1200]|nr:hypothetical protein IWW48_003102 [Coemansia sp. RSA 1200]
MPSYEDERARQMRENAEFLASLQIGSIVPVKAAAPKRVAKPRDNDEYKPIREYNIRKRSKLVSYRENDGYIDTSYAYKRSKGKKGSAGGKLRRADPGRRVVGNRVYDSKLGHTCHQCRQKTIETKIHCSSSTCNVMFDYRCLLVRYNEDAETIDHSSWLCPKCRGICNCSFCMKKRGKRPTGQLSTFIKANGCDAAETAIKADNINPGVLLSAQNGTRKSGYMPRRMQDELYEHSEAENDDDDESDSEGKYHDGNPGKPAYSLRARSRSASMAVAQSFYSSESSDSDESEDDSDMQSEYLFTGWKHCPPNIDWLVLIDN